ncbi:hypothetical protein NEOLI_005353 [Neolecta irregularis DAH-3]|uniref:Protein ORM1 n=1 Tax=Neolecta irregularis (strain DAH-3) TaxID=1198029 RepID=A0A1U7LM09_NEOID|nr:hypothetical protein NEOLI_005353 [Neolecta irregularis DAH-3]|eukprot:OLL23700.1 hypothetical protein NEOLI_005353 [Neolecta irregularis DAH-3]
MTMLERASPYKEISRRRSSSLVMHQVVERADERLDQQSEPNWNSSWVNSKGAWAIHIVIIIALKILFNSVPWVSQEVGWTLTNLSYMAVGSYLMFHYVRGIPFEFNAGAFDDLVMWEQIDNEAQYTPTKKWLTFVPILL